MTNSSMCKYAMHRAHTTTYVRILIVFGANFLLLHVIPKHLPYVVVLIGMFIDLGLGVAQ